MTHLVTPVEDTTAPVTDPRPWRWAGGLALAHVVVLLAAVSQENAMVSHGDSFAKVQQIYGETTLGRTLGAGYVEALSFLLIMPAIVLLAWLFGRRTQLGRVASQSFLGLGIAFVGSTLAVGFPAGAAAVYAAHHGVDPATIATVNDIRNYGYVLQVALLAGMTLALGIAALTDRVHRRWVGWGGVALGAVGLVLTPFAHIAISTAWMVWWVGLAVLLLRGAPASRSDHTANA